jgi:tetratricopeptide (TPR) repeat protein
VCAGYAGDEVRARTLLDRAFAAIDVSGVVSHRGFAHYAAAELAAATDPDAAIEHYGRAIELARSSGASLIEAIASVGLVRLWVAAGQVGRALEGYRRLLVDLRRSGHWTQLWTTLRNLAAAWPRPVTPTRVPWCSALRTLLRRPPSSVCRPSPTSWRR